jgi:squalene synthase HpnC
VPETIEKPTRMAVDHYENFPVASILMPARLRPPVTVIYAFARSADDFADEGDVPPAERLAALDAYRAELDRIEAGAAPQTPLFERLAAVIAEFRLPVQPFRDLLDAFSQDVVKTRYASFAEVMDYCRRSADPVGRLMLHLYGEATPVNMQQSDAICSALQLVNFWQDVAIDWRKDRVYLPQEDLARFGVTEDQIAAGRTNDAWRALIAFEVGRARAMLHSGAPLARALPGRIGWEIRMILQGGLRILEKIERVRGDVFRHRPVLGPLDWPLMLARAASNRLP